MHIVKKHSFSDLYKLLVRPYLKSKHFLEENPSKSKSEVYFDIKKVEIFVPKEPDVVTLLDTIGI